MDSITIINNKFSNALSTAIRDKSADVISMRENLVKLGQVIGQEILGNEFTSLKAVQTPMNLEFSGLFLNKPNVVIISTKDDYEYYLRGLASTFLKPTLGYMDFSGLRGKETYQSPIRSLVIPELQKGKAIDAVIIAKSVLATGCTAVTLAKSAYERYMPNKLIIAACFYSNEGILEVKNELPNCKLYLVGNPDKINSNGYLEPGVGNLDLRTSSL